MKPNQEIIADLLQFDMGARFYTHEEQPVWGAWHVAAYDVTFHDDGITLVPASVSRSCWASDSPRAFIAAFQHAVFALLASPSKMTDHEYVMRPGKPHAVRLTRIPLYPEGEIT